MSGLLELCLCVSCLTNGRSYKQDPMLSIISYAHINSIEYRARSQDVAQDMEQREQWSAQASAALCALYSISCAISCDRAR